MATKTDKIRAMALPKEQVERQKDVISRLDEESRALLLHYIDLSNSLLDIIESK